jgi:hypothetical protein
MTLDSFHVLNAVEVAKGAKIFAAATRVARSCGWYSRCGRSGGACYLSFTLPHTEYLVQSSAVRD